jgi:predicted nuclease of predicted toxin-antitoxin system
MAVILTDEHIDPRICQQLSLLGHQIKTVRSYSVNKSGDAWSDEQIIRFAIKHGWITLTENASDFCQLAKQYPHHPGIILTDPDHLWSQAAKRIDKAIREAGGSLYGQVVNLTARPPAKVRRQSLKPDTRKIKRKRKPAKKRKP